jgi:hypothetical protein
MTDDPVKLYVVVMAILVGVLGWVAKTSYDQASDYKAAIASAPEDARKFTELASRVSALVKQLTSSKLKDLDHVTLIENAARAHLGGTPPVKSERPQRIPPKGQELRWTVTVTRSSTGGTNPVTRNQIARFCRQVELDSQGILKVIEIVMNRTQSEGSPAVGAPAEIRDDRYTTTLVVGMRVVD